MKRVTITAKEGYHLFNGVTFTNYLNTNEENVDNWQEVTEEFKQEWERTHPQEDKENEYGNTNV
jgi:hypothetical protein